MRLIPYLEIFLKKQTGGMHGVLLTAVSPIAFKQALAALRIKGTISLNGLPTGNFDLPIFDTVLNRYTIIDASTILLRGKTFKLPQQRGFIEIPTTVGEHTRKK